MVTPSYLSVIAHQVKTLPSRVLGVQRVCHPLLAGLVFVGAGLLGCSPRYDDLPAYWPIPTKEHDNYGPGRFKTALLADQIDRFYRGSAPGPIGVTTFVNIDDLYTSSTFGRMVGEQLMSELAMKGFDVIELRHTDALQFLDTSGEFALSRDVRAVRPERNLAAVVVGTYVNSPERVYLNARLIDPSSSLVLSAGSVEMSKTRELTKLLRGGTLPGALERIPVRHLGYTTMPSNLYDSQRKKWDMEESEWSVPNRGGMPSTPPVTLPELQVEKASPASKKDATARAPEVPGVSTDKTSPVITSGPEIQIVP